MKVLDMLLEYLEQHRIRYEHRTHPAVYTAQAVARVEHLQARDVAKTVVYWGDRGYGMAVLPADRHVDLKKLCSALDVLYVRLATERELTELFPESEVGAMPPFGNLFDFPVHVDRELAERETIAFNAGTHKDVVQMSYRDFDRLVQPQVTELALDLIPVSG